MHANHINEVISYLDIIIAKSKAEKSRVGLFAALYRQVTLKILQGIHDGVFDDNQRMDNFAAKFGNRYFEALLGYENGEKITKSWQVAFDATQQTNAIIIQHLLLGVNAHINLDLGIIAAQICPGEKLSTFANDFQMINTQLTKILDEIQGVVNQFSPLFDILDRIGGRNDEEVVKFSLTKARAHAWNVAEKLAFLPMEQQQETITEVDEKIAFLGRIIISPSRILDKGLDLIQQAESDDIVAVIDTLNKVMG